MFICINKFSHIFIWSHQVWSWWYFVFSGDANPTKIAARISSKPSCRCCSTKLSKLFEFRLIITWELRKSPGKVGKKMMCSTLFRDVKPVHGGLRVRASGLSLEGFTTMSFLKDVVSPSICWENVGEINPSRLWTNRNVQTTPGPFDLWSN